MHFADRLTKAIKAKRSVVCVGLDPEFSQLPGFLTKKMLVKHGQTLEAAANAVLEFNKGIIDAVKDVAPVVKVQLAFYEELGHDGIWAFEETCRYAGKQGLLVIVDGKRNDIGSTAEAYSRAYLKGTELFGKKFLPVVCDALTVNAYLGFDTVRPFLKACEEAEKGIFVLVRTSNPSSSDVESRVAAEEKMSVAAIMAHFVESWGSDKLGECGYSCVGAVVAATFSKEAKSLRKIMQSSIFLVPGYGAQGGTAEDTAPCFDKDGLGAIVNSSRGIIFAYKTAGATKEGEDFAEAARDAAVTMRDDLNRVR